jgi:nucleoside-diphosphate-sugar epimerase
MTVLVIGASGFLGAALVRHFSQKGENVATLSFRPATQAAFLKDLEALLKQRCPRAVINAGASQTGKEDPAALEELLLSNVFLPATLASFMGAYVPEACLINFGTSWQINEAGEFSPFNAYAASKSAAEPFLDHFALNGLRTATLRLYDTYGPNDPRNKVINLITDALIAKRELPMSSGEQQIDLIHVDDVVAAVEATLAFLSREKEVGHKVFAVRSGKPVTVLEVLALLKQAAGVEEAPFIKPGIYPYRVRERFSLFSDTPTPPGWHPRIELAQGLAQMLDGRRKAAWAG